VWLVATGALLLRFGGHHELVRIHVLHIPPSAALCVAFLVGGLVEGRAERRPARTWAGFQNGGIESVLAYPRTLPKPLGLRQTVATPQHQLFGKANDDARATGHRCTT